MRPFYDEPEFAIRNIWRLYGGWWDGHPARLKPAPDVAVGAEVARLAGGAGALASRAMELSESGDFKLACHLIEFAAAAEPESAEGAQRSFDDLCPTRQGGKLVDGQRHLQRGQGRI